MLCACFCRMKKVETEKAVEEQDVWIRGESSFVAGDALEILG